ncbi:GntR family transcriptional regulator [Arenibaculum pallidiluteum]|uniref:GntR family transcriptional regulator n=1 Tax=Arenibaculum pallidiluteum TaxID=2812559 RepID=UPI001A95714D|nr:GntR family transcriptional regulator [Arenibaculum pallidiluteum]
MVLARGTVMDRQRAQAAEGPASAPGIHAALRRDIVVLGLRPGTRLSENELAERFGTSRTPVREALIRLAEEGLIEVRPQRGSFVTRISLRAVRRARFVRLALEVAIVRKAAEDGLSAAAIAEIEAALAEQEAERAVPVRFTVADERFHQALAVGIGLGEVWAVVEREKAQFDRIRFLSLSRATPVDLLIEQHRAIFSAVMARDAAAAEGAMRRHMAEVLKVVDDLAAAHPELIAADE